MTSTSAHVVILGAGFGGLELSARLSAVFGDGIEITLIDKNDAFIFGFSKFELMFGRQHREAVSSYYRAIAKPGVQFRQELVTSIDPVSRRVVTDNGAYSADVLVVALGADYDFGATPGFADGGHEFYSVAGALRLRDVLPTVTSGHVVVAVLSEPFKCPPAPCEAAMLLDEYFSERGVRNSIRISVISPWGIPIPASGPASTAILDRFRERSITFVPSQGVTAIDPATKSARLRDGTAMPYDLFLGVPIHRVPAVVEASGLAVDGWIPVDKANLSTRFPDVYAIGDVTSAPVPKAGIFAESAGRAVAEHLTVKLRNEGSATPYDGAGSCFIEFGDHRVGRVDVDFLTGPSVVAPFTEASLQGAEEKKEFASSRRARWFGG
ncbi:MAG: NAD(P)/FAD-dependent oxidoreductase [Chloroflexota bacterium]|nr:NAD(P)/FAD-dependent oxidoreductase [Chloroflexota bacterium]